MRWRSHTPHAHVALGQHKSLVEAQARLSDVYITRSLKLTLLWKRSSGLTQASTFTMENQSVEPWWCGVEGIEELTRMARRVRLSLER